MGKQGRKVKNKNCLAHTNEKQPATFFTYIVSFTFIAVLDTMYPEKVHVPG